MRITGERRFVNEVPDEEWWVPPTDIGGVRESLNAPRFRHESVPVEEVFAWSPGDHDQAF
jgi:hypothetical protein